MIFLSQIFVQFSWHISGLPSPSLVVPPPIHEMHYAQKHEQTLINVTSRLYSMRVTLWGRVPTFVQFSWHIWPPFYLRGRGGNGAEGKTLIRVQNRTNRIDLTQVSWQGAFVPKLRRHNCFQQLNQQNLLYIIPVYHNCKIGNKMMQTRNNWLNPDSNWPIIEGENCKLNSKT